MPDEREQFLQRDPRTVDPASVTCVVDSKDNDNPEVCAKQKNRSAEIGGRAGPDPTRYGDWEKAGRCVDF